LGLQLKDRGRKVILQITEKLKNSKAEFKLVEHEEVRTSQEAADVRGTKLSDGAKAMILSSKEYEGKMIMLVVPADKNIDLEKVKDAFGEEFEFALKEKVEELTGLKIGAIPPFGRMFGLELYFDKTMYKKEDSAFNCGLRTNSIIMKASDLIKNAQPNKMSKNLDLIL
jgi:Ala-tRNA(Pro) deacylase